MTVAVKWNGENLDEVLAALPPGLAGYSEVSGLTLYLDRAKPVKVGRWIVGTANGVTLLEEAV